MSRALLPAIAGLSLSCGDKTEVFRVEPEVNYAPVIVRQGPDWGSGPIDLSAQSAPQPYVVAADPNGAADIALAVFDIETAILRRLVVRPDSLLPYPYCSLIAWTDSIDITAMLPGSFAAVVENCAMLRNGTSFHFSFSYDPYGGGGCSSFPTFVSASPFFGPPLKGCNGEYPLSRFGIYPPGVPAALNANVTFAEIEYRGLRATVYDGAGLTATADFPNLRLVYRHYNEKLSPP